jgi:hypothetical protein
MYQQNVNRKESHKRRNSSIDDGLPLPLVEQQQRSKMCAEFSFHKR